MSHAAIFAAPTRRAVSTTARDDIAKIVADARIAERARDTVSIIAIVNAYIARRRRVLVRVDEAISMGTEEQVAAADWVIAMEEVRRRAGGFGL